MLNVMPVYAFFPYEYGKGLWNYVKALTDLFHRSNVGEGHA